MSEVLVSIWCITYNHELYIRDAIESFLSQKTDFQYEIFIHDDASTDNTAKIIREYEKNYPKVIHGIYQSENQYSRNLLSMKWLYTIQKQYCKRKYIATCEGDDYWIDPYKLQTQIEYMEAHPDCILTIHNAVGVNYDSGEIKAWNPFEKGGVLSAEEIIKQSKGHIPAASMVYKKEAEEMEGYFLDLGIGDYPIELYCMSRGMVYYFSKIMSVYRYNHEGSYGKGIVKDKKRRFLHCVSLISFLDQYNQYTNKFYERFVIDRLQRTVDEILFCYIGYEPEQFAKVCREYDDETGYKYHAYIEEVIRIYFLIFKDSFDDINLQGFSNIQQKIYIMGAGRYAAIIAKKLNKRNIEYQGFVVSNNQECQKEYLGKGVWRFHEISSELHDASIIIGINPCIWSQVIEQLEEMDIEKYVCPFRLRVKGID